MADLTYKQAGDYLIPDLTLDGAEELEEMPLGKYGMLRQTFLEEHHHGTYTSMLLTGRLYPHLREIDWQAREQVDRMVADLKKQNGGATPPGPGGCIGSGRIPHTLNPCVGAGGGQPPPRLCVCGGTARPWVAGPVTVLLIPHGGGTDREYCTGPGG